MTKPLKVLDLFSGIGGFSLGLERAGMETLAFCEIEPFCQKVLKKHWPDVPLFEDIRTLTVNDLKEKPDIVVGGYPCQPFSVAGKQRGTTDDRHLWPEMYRIIQECKPTWVIAENVAGHISMGLDTVLFDLEAAGYEAQPFVIPACAVNAIHRRDRVWIVGYSEHSGSLAAEVERKSGEASDNSTERKIETVEPTGAIKSGSGGGVPEGQQKTVSNPRSNRLQMRPKKPFHGFQHLQGELARSGEIIGISTNEGQSFIPGVYDGLSGGVDDRDRANRVKALGNSVVPQIPEIIGRAILATYQTGKKN